MRNWCRSFSVGPDGVIAWLGYCAGRQELWSPRLALPAP